jgi:excisionase family DNA binding protein
MTTTVSPATMTIPEFRDWSKISRSQIYREIGSGALPAIKVGRRTLITTEAATAWLAAQRPYAG